MTAQSTLRRALVGAAGVAIALLTALSVAAPATASGPLLTTTTDKPKISVSVKGYNCVNGSWNVEWKVSNSGVDGTVVDVQPGGVKVGDLDLLGAGLARGESKTATQRVPGSASSATLKVAVGWGTAWKSSGRSPVSGSETVRFKGTCSPSTKCISADQARFAHEFDGPAGKASIWLTSNQPLCAGQSQKFLLVSYFAPSPRAEWPQYKYSSAVGTIDADHPSIDLAVDVPGCFTQVDFVFGDKLINPMVANGERYNNRKVGSGGAPGNRSSGKPAWFNGGKTSCAVPEATLASNCEGTVSVHLSAQRYAATFTVTAGLSGGFTKEVTVPAGESREVTVPKEYAEKITVTSNGDFVREGMWLPGHCKQPDAQIKSTCDDLVVSVQNPEGNLPADAVITYGAQVEKLTVEAGQAKEVTFKATDKTEVTVDFPDFRQTVKLVYDRPGNCATPTPSPEPSTPGQPSTSPSPETPGLPVTGIQVGLFAGFGGLLLAMGAVLYIGARRRRLTEVQ